MSGFNPLTALAQNAVAAAQQSMAEATLNLGAAIAEVIASQVAVGDLIEATVLPPQGGNDLVSMLGQTVIAQLPPGVNPGESLLLQVTAFNGNQIVVRNLGVVDPDNPVPTVQVEVPSEASDGPQQAVLRTVVPADPPVLATPAPGTQPPSTATPPQTTGTPASVAPPRAVFVAASVRPSVPAPASANSASSNSASASGAVEEGEIAIVPERLGVEARIAANRAANAEVNVRASRDAPGPPISRSASALPIRSADLPRPQIAQSIPPPAVQPRPAASSMRAAMTASRIAEAPTPEEALLARLRVPVTPATLAAAKLVDDAGQALPRALERLDAYLAQLRGTDSRVATLRTLLGFAKLDPGNSRALPEQLASFVNNLLDGAEAKVAAIVRAFSNVALAAAEEEPAAPDAAPASAAAAQDAQLPGAAAQLPGAQTLPPAIQGQVAERTVALNYDVKTAIMSLVQSPPAGGSAALAQSLGEALTALTALQLNVLNSQTNNPNVITIPLPMFYREGGQPAQMRISRDGGNGKPMDSDNFHVAFLLDTQSLGTVAIDLQSVGRAVSLNVKTERAPAAGRFRSTLAELRSRLEHLRYRVASMSADVAPVRSAVADAAAAVPTAKPSSQVDMRA